MDAALYKDVTTTRGFKYHYFYSPPQSPSRHTVLFCHGFPSTSTEWRKMAPYFKDKGYGILVPDMLGYGGTDKPTDPEAYASGALVQDLVDILNAEKIDRVVAVGHDWGCRPVSRLANFAPERVTAYAFFALSYVDPAPDVPFMEILESTKKHTGQELFGYWLFFDEDDVDKTIREHIETFADMRCPGDPTLWDDRVGKTGGLKQSLLEDFRCPSAPYFTAEDRAQWIEEFREGGFAAPTCWYKAMTRGIAAKGDKEIAADRKYPPSSSPIFFGGAKQDRVCRPEAGEEVLKRPEFKDHKVTVKVYDADHWLVWSVPEELNRDLDAWMEGFAPAP